MVFVFETLEPQEEQKFQVWYKQKAQKLGLNPNPDDPRHFYDYRAAYLAGGKPDKTGHFPSEFKLEGHPRRFVFEDEIQPKSRFVFEEYLGPLETELSEAGVEPTTLLEAQMGLISSALLKPKPATGKLPPKADKPQRRGYLGTPEEKAKMFETPMGRILGAVGRPIAAGISEATLGIPEIALGEIPEPQSIIESVGTAGTRVLGFLRGGPMKAAEAIIGKKLAPTKTGLRGLSQIMIESGAKLGLAGATASVVPSITKSESLWNYADKVITDTGTMALIGTLYPAMGVVPTKSLRLATGLAIMDKIRAGASQWFTADDIAKAVAEGTIDKKELADSVFGYLLDIYFLNKVPSVKKQFIALKVNNTQKRKILDIKPEEVTETIKLIGYEQKPITVTPEGIAILPERPEEILLTEGILAEKPRAMSEAEIAEAKAKITEPTQAEAQYRAMVRSPEAMEKGGGFVKGVKPEEVGFLGFPEIKKTFSELVDKIDATIEKRIEKDIYKSVEADTNKMQQYITTLPDDQKREAINQMVKDLGWSKHIKKDITDLIRVPIWDKDVAPVTEELQRISQRASEITSWAERELKFLAKHDPSQEMVDTIVNSTLKGELTEIEKLSPKEQWMVRHIFRTTEGMLKKFEEEMRKAVTPSGRRAFERIAKAEGYDDVDRYITDWITKHKREMYFPLMRADGDYIVYAKKDRETIWAENFKTVNKAKKRIAELMGQFPDAEIKVLDAKEVYRFKFPELVEMIHDLPYMRNILKSKNVSEENINTLQDILSGAYLQVWAKGRFAKREGIKGFSTDIKAVLDNYITTFPRSFVRRFNAGKIAGIVQEVPIEKRNYAKDLVDYYLGRQDYEGKWNYSARNIIHNWNLAFKPSFAILNLTQRGTTTLWRAFSEAGFKGGEYTLKAQAKELAFYKELAVKAITKRFDTRDTIRTSKIFDPIEKNILIKLLDRGVLQTVRTTEITGKSKISNLLNILGIASEKSNRLHAGLTALYLGKTKGLSGEELFDYVNDFINKTQWLYAKEARPEIGRGWKAPAFVFKTYVFNDLNFMKDLYPNKKVFAGAIATRLALGGLGGFYGVGLLIDTVDWAMAKIVGKDDWEIAKLEAKKKLASIAGRKTIDIATKGLPSVVNIHGSILFGSPELFDIAAIPLVKGAWRDIKIAVERGGVDWEQFIRRRTPATIRHLMGFDPKDIFGRERLTEIDIKRLPVEIRERAMEIYETMPEGMPDYEKILYAIGFTTTTPSEIYEAINAIKSSAVEVKRTKADYHRNIGKALAEGRDEDADRLIDEAKTEGIRLDKRAIKEQQYKFGR